MRLPAKKGPSASGLPSAKTGARHRRARDANREYSKEAQRHQRRQEPTRYVTDFRDRTLELAEGFVDPFVYFVPEFKGCFALIFLKFVEPFKQFRPRFAFNLPFSDEE